MFKRKFLQAVIISVLLCFGVSALADDCLSVKNPKQLKEYQGNYIASDLLQKILGTRNVFAGQAQWEHGVFSQAIFVKAISDPGNCEDNVTGTNWHESQTFVGATPHACGEYQESGTNLCVAPAGKNKLALENNEQVQETYRKIPLPVADFLFQRLFNGCYIDEASKPVCFNNGIIDVDGKQKKAELMLDGSELAQEGSYLRVTGDNLFWVFVPIQSGWKVYKSDWASKDDYVPIDLQKPWKVLTRTSPISH